MKKIIIKAFQEFFLLNEISIFFSNRKSKRRSKYFRKGFSWVMNSYFIDNIHLEEINSYVEINDVFNIDDTAQTFNTGAQEALNVIWLQTGHNVGFYKDNMK